MSLDIHEGVYLGLGANLGDRQANLRAALAALPPAVIVRRISNLYETAPWGYRHQPAFLNLVAEVATQLTPLELLAYLKNIETSLGRLKTFRYGPRLIDMDILLYGQTILQLAELNIPHPEMEARAFVLVPLAELAPHLLHPLTHLTIAEMCAKVNADEVKLFPTNDQHCADR